MVKILQALLSRPNTTWEGADLFGLTSATWKAERVHVCTGVDACLPASSTPSRRSEPGPSSFSPRWSPSCFGRGWRQPWRRLTRAVPVWTAARPSASRGWCACTACSGGEACPTKRGKTRCSPFRDCAHRGHRPVAQVKTRCDNAVEVSPATVGANDQIKPKFDEINEHLARQGLLMRGGSIVDAAIDAEPIGRSTQTANAIPRCIGRRRAASGKSG